MLETENQKSQDYLKSINAELSALRGKLEHASQSREELERRLQYSQKELDASSVRLLDKV